MIYIFYKKSKTLYLIRPLLIINRLEVFKLVLFWGLPVFVDSTNKLTNFRRNRLRHQICPILRIFFNPKIEIAILRFIETANFEKNYFQRQLYGIKYLFQIKKFKRLNSKKNKINSKVFIPYLPYGIQKLIYRNLLFFYFEDSSPNELNCLIKLKIFNSYKNNLK